MNDKQRQDAYYSAMRTETVRTLVRMSWPLRNDFSGLRLSLRSLLARERNLRRSGG